jgi:hypothetical protein
MEFIVRTGFQSSLWEKNIRVGLVSGRLVLNRTDLGIGE